MGDRTIRICLADQSLELLDGERVAQRYDVSTAAKGAGEQNGSLQTPRGAHEVKELIGAGAPCGAVFSARCPTGEILTRDLQTEHPERDWILSRVIWLSGLEDGRNRGGNVDTYERYIYIHGTPEDQPMGQPHSHGCVRMRNEDVIALFEELRVGTKVQIDE